MNCKNCGEKVQGKYCSHCGQSSHIDKLTLSNLLNELAESVFQINRGFFYTLKELFSRPGDRIKEYLGGRRKKYFKPISYVLLLSTIYFLITQITGQNTWMDDLISGFSIGAQESGKGTEVPPALIWFSKNFAYTTLLLLPVFSLASYLSFRDLGRNYLEHFVVNSYITGQQAVFYSLFAIMKVFTDSRTIEMLSVLIAFLFTLWVFWQFFEAGNRILNILRSVLTYILYLIFRLWVLFMIMGISEITN